MAKQATNIRLFTAEQIPHPGANQQKANARPWEQVQLKMPDKRPGGGWAAMELIETLVRGHSILYSIANLVLLYTLKLWSFCTLCFFSGNRHSRIIKCIAT